MYSPPLSSTTSLTTPNVSWYLNLTSRSSPLPQVVQTDQVQSSTWTGTRPGQARSPHWALCLPSSAAGSVQACQSVGQYNVRREEIKTLSKQIPCNLVFKNNFSSIEMSFLLHNLYSLSVIVRLLPHSRTGSTKSHSASTSSRLRTATGPGKR